MWLYWLKNQFKSFYQSMSVRNIFQKTISFIWIVWTTWDSSCLLSKIFHHLSLDNGTHTLLGWHKKEKYLSSHPTTSFASTLHHLYIFCTYVLSERRPWNSSQINFWKTISLTSLEDLGLRLVKYSSKFYKPLSPFEVL